MPLPRAQLARTRFDAIGIFSNLFSAEAFFRQIRFGFNRFFSIYLALIVLDLLFDSALIFFIQLSPLMDFRLAFSLSRLENKQKAKKKHYK